jgi:predicted Fe-Mo cluster-binding NifX family protein
MKVAIASQRGALSDPVAEVFGRCRFFVLADTESDVFERVANPGCDAPGGAGVDAAQCLIDRGVQVVVAPRFGPKADAVLRAAGIRELRRGSCTGREVLDELRRESRR